VHKMLPMTLGANIGTTFTALLAALGVLAPETLQIALCALVGWKDGHMIFNIMGILVWFPVPFMRRVVVNAACMLGLYASYWRLVPLLYILVMPPWPENGRWTALIGADRSYSGLYIYLLKHSEADPHQ
ncbi:unnamed protein product, partial [Durusdinium trenchii]